MKNFISKLFEKISSLWNKERKQNPLYRFVEAQDKNYEIALAEIKAGKKQTHWIWYTFPQLKGLGKSAFADYYGIQDMQEAKQYLAHPKLGKRLRECAEALLAVEGKGVRDIFGELDAMKVRSSMTLFDLVSPNDLFAQVLEQYYDGKRCELTIKNLLPQEYKPQEEPNNIESTSKANSDPWERVRLTPENCKKYMPLDMVGISYTEECGMPSSCTLEMVSNCGHRFILDTREFVLDQDVLEEIVPQLLYYREHNTAPEGWHYIFYKDSTYRLLHDSIYKIYQTLVWQNDESEYCSLEQDNTLTDRDWMDVAIEAVYLRKYVGGGPINKNTLFRLCAFDAVRNGLNFSFVDVMKKYGVGYERADEIIDRLQAAGIISEIRYDAVHPDVREVFIKDISELNALLKKIDLCPISRGGILGAILGDIAGSRFEFRNEKSTDVELFTDADDFTDDTVMTIAVADWLMNGTSLPNIMRDWATEYPNSGYGGMFYRWLFPLDESEKKPYNSFGNGAGMRVSPCGYIARTLDEALDLAKQSAEVSHNHPEGIKGAQAIAAAIFLARQHMPKPQIRRYIEKVFGYDLQRTCDDIRPTYGFDETCQGSCPEAIIAFLDSTDYESAIRLAISLGGDSDTIACMTGGIAAAYYGIPDWMIEKAVKYLPADMIDIINRFDGRELKKNRYDNI